MLAFALFITGCETKETVETDTSVTPQEDSEDILDTMEEYITAYCDVYSMRCGGVYASQSECEAAIADMWGDKECEVTDPPLLQECIEWLAEFPCEETGWIDACDNFYTCD